MRRRRRRHLRPRRRRHPGLRHAGRDSFQALNAPMLVDSYALQAAVLESGITDTMMQSLERHRPDRRRHAGRHPAQAGVGGEGSRRARPTGRESPSAPTSPRPSSRLSGARGDSEGRVRRRPRPGAAGRLHGRLRVQPAPLPAQQPPRAGAVRHHQRHALAPDADALRRPRRGRRGSPTAQRDWLRQAAEEAESRSAELADADAGSLEEACALGARPVQAPDADLAALAGGVRAGLRQAGAGTRDQAGPRPDRGAEGVDPGPTRLERLDGLCGVGPVGRGCGLGHHSRGT